MSMSQEDIEALMNGLDIPTDDATDVKEEKEEKVNTKEIEELLSQAKEDELSSSKEEKINEIEDILSDIEDDKIDIVEDKKEEDNNKMDLDISKDEIVKEWSSSKINAGVFPFPAENDTKVVSQLSQVANDSEEKVSKIFDVLSLTLDNNNELRNKLKEFEDFVASQNKLLDSLIKKFPNIKIFNKQLNKAKNVQASIQSVKDNIDDEDMQIFQGMELMQFNDINRQKIERVMSVIRKLSIYLNNLFEEDNPKDIPMAKYIHGDRDTEDLVGEDLDKLIEEFNK